jgi:transglutaminase-like putative cysteine protease
VTDPTLSPTRYIESSSLAIVQLAREITRSASHERDAAVAIHNWVRDQIKFGFTGAFYDMTATQVLDAGVGYCNTKSTLFNALLRASRIPTRLHFVALSGSVLRGLLSPGEYVDHSWTEIRLSGKWHSVDSYVVDAPLVRAANVQLQREGAPAGYGVHRTGTSDWLGSGDAFIQSVPTAVDPNWIARDFGYYADVADFYERCDGALNRQSLIQSGIFTLFSRSVNRRIERVRAAAL